MQRANAPTQKTVSTTSSSAGSVFAAKKRENQYPNWVFTLQFGLDGQPDEDDAMAMLAKLHSRVQYMVAGKEVAPTTGQPHFQGYVQLKKPARRTELVKIVPMFWEPAGGDDQENFDYCTKEGDYFEEGTRREINPGKREKLRWKEARDLAIAGDWMAIDPQIFVSQFTNVRAIHKDFMTLPEAIDDTCGVWIHGEAGVGKSFSARERFPDAYLKLANKWWDGYKGQKFVILDDFDKSHAMLGHHLKIWADRYPFIAEIKGGAISIRPEKFVVTSQYHPEDIWSDKETLDAIKRRFKIERLGVPSDAPEGLRAAFNKPPTPRKATPHPSPKRTRDETPPRPKQKKSKIQVIDLTQSDDEDSDDTEAVRRILRERRSLADQYAASRERV